VSAATSHRVLRRGALSMRVHRRTAVISLLLVLAVLITAAVTLVVPGAGIGTAEALAALTGRDGGFAATVVLSWRLPRVVAAILVGAGLAIAGAIFQTLTRNPLGSPDVIGFGVGAYTGVILVLLAGTSGFGFVAFGALAGGLVTAVAVYLLSLRPGTSGMRMVVVGLGVSAMLSALNRWLLLTAELDTSMAAATWGAGSLNGVRWGAVLPGAIVLGILLICAWPLSRGLDVLGMGDDTAAGLGIHLSRSRLALVLVGVGLTAAATAVAGPVAFIALAAPHVARRLARGSRVSGVPVAATGALLLLLADLVAQRMLDPLQLPVGIVTVVLGGLYLLTLLARETRR
jgi:iron complex transport system permease protein